MKLMRKIWDVFWFNLPVTIFTVVWLGGYMVLVEFDILPSTFTVLGIWMFVWLFMCVYLIDLVERKGKHDS